MITYKTFISDFGQDFIIKVNEDLSEVWIPTDPANSDYQEYLKRVEDEASAL